ncbi:MAG TPA: GerAB/ArcD/ProY family transporter, partial [Mobilitalea sp.]|nr:GerAB/ArcD/ProY family transporter [Mobilitalea sp.]
NALAKEAGRSGYLSPLWSVIALIPLTAIIIALIKKFPGLNIYEIMSQLLGVFLSKLLVIFYLLWLLLSITSKVNIYALTVQFTLMPQTKSNFFMILLIILVYYALFRGLRTIFRFSEFALGPILFLFILLFVCALSKLRFDYLLPVSTFQVPSTIIGAKDVIAVGGNIVIVLFFADKFDIAVTKEQKRKLWSGIAVFIALTFIITLFTYGVNGADLTSILPFPFYITVKSISFFNVFERFEVLITLICILSDFISVCILAVLLMRCFEWLFNLKEHTFLYVPLTIMIFYLTYYVSSTQFEFAYLYRNIIVYSNLIFQFLIPVLLGILCLFKREKIQKQY